jgi:hypothetical protein
MENIGYSGITLCHDDKTNECYLTWGNGNTDFIGQHDENIKDRAITFIINDLIPRLTH